MKKDNLFRKDRPEFPCYMDYCNKVNKAETKDAMLMVLKSYGKVVGSSLRILESLSSMDFSYLIFLRNEFFQEGYTDYKDEDAKFVEILAPPLLVAIFKKNLNNRKRESKEIELYNFNIGLQEKKDNTKIKNE